MRSRTSEVGQREAVIKLPSSECLFKKPLGRRNLLNGCNYVYGNLVLDSPVVGMTGARLNRVEGDVFISNNPVDSLDFLRETTIFGKFGESFWFFKEKVLCREFPL